jgi:transposase
MDLKLPVLRMEVKQLRKSEPRVVERLLALIEVAKVCQDWGEVAEADIQRIAARSETSARTLYRWMKAYDEGGVQALIPKSPPGRKANPIRGWVAKKIREYRKLYNWGAEVIQAHLERDDGIVLSQDKIHRFLKKKGLSRKRIRKRGSKHTRVVKVEQPGTHTQTDVKHLPKLLENGQKCYVYNFVDHACRWTYKRAYDSYGPSETRDFMQRVIKHAPFPITRAQTDNGIEFTFRYVSHADDPKERTSSNHPPLSPTA